MDNEICLNDLSMLDNPIISEGLARRAFDGLTVEQSLIWIVVQLHEDLERCRENTRCMCSKNNDAQDHPMGKQNRINQEAK